MKVFTKITSHLSTSASLIMVVLTFGLVGCMKIVELPQDVDQDPNELTFTATRPLPIEKASLTPSRATLDEFTTGSAIGLFSQLKSESDNGSGVVLKGNSLYRYDLPVWQAASKQDKLLYHETDPIYVFGYYPHPSMSGSSTSIAAGASVVSYVLPKDQSLEANVKAADLLWVGAKNEGVGFMRQRQPINLVFVHKLCKVSFYVKLIDSKPGVNTENKVNLRSLAAIGSQITSDVQLDVLSGLLSPTFQTNHFDSVRWESQTAGGVELTVGADPVHVADLLLVPFVAVQSQNWFRYILHYPVAGMDQSFSANIPVHDPAAVGGVSSMLCFESNKHNKVTVTIDVSSAYITISAEIAPWGMGPEVELPTDPA